MVSVWPRMAGPFFLVACTTLMVSAGCGVPDPELVPDEVLQATLGLEADDRVHTIGLVTGAGERAEPGSVEVLPGDLVEFVSTDWFVHEVRFEVDGLDPELREFLTRTDQLASPPLLQRDARFVVSFRGAPPGRYPYVLVGNRASGEGEIVVVTAGAAPAR